MADNTAFALGLITSALQWIMVMLSWILTTYLGRRTIYAWQFYHLAKVLLKLYNSKCPRGVDVVTFNSQVEVCTSLNSASQD